MRFVQGAQLGAAMLVAMMAVRSAAAQNMFQPVVALSGDTAVVQKPAPSASQDSPAAMSLAGGSDECPLAFRQPGVIAYVDWLYWRYRSPSTSYAESQQFFGGGLVGISDDQMNLPDNSGIRVGLGYRFNSDWDTTWNYTYFHTDGQASAAAPAGGGLLPPGLGLSFPFPFSAFGYSTVTASAAVNYSVNDIDVGRWVELNETLNVRLFGGFRWATTRQDMREDFVPAVAFPGSNNGIDTYGIHTKMDAYGLRLGSEIRWRLCNTDLSLFGRGAGSVLVGNFQTSETTLDLGGDAVNVNRSDVHVVPVFETAAGIAWQHCNWEIAGGYELAAWLDQASIPDAVVFHPASSYSTMLLDGFFTRISYKY